MIRPVPFGTAPTFSESNALGILMEYFSKLQKKGKSGAETQARARRRNYTPVLVHAVQEKRRACRC